MAPSPTVRAACLLAICALLISGAVNGSAFAAAGLLPNLVELPPTDIHVTPSADGRSYDLRFTSTAGNTGSGPLVVSASRVSPTKPFRIVQLIAIGDGTNTVHPVATSMRFQSAIGHDHFHLARFERYELLDSNGNVLVRDSKAGYCLGDRVKLGTPAGPARFDTNCGLGKPLLLSLREGISTGWADPYEADLPGQSFTLTGLAAGTYTLVNRVNDRRAYVESNYGDDVAAATLKLAWPDGAAGAPTVTVVGTCLAVRC